MARSSKGASTLRSETTMNGSSLTIRPVRLTNKGPADSFGSMPTPSPPPLIFLRGRFFSKLPESASARYPFGFPPSIYCVVRHGLLLTLARLLGRLSQPDSWHPTLTRLHGGFRGPKYLCQSRRLRVSNVVNAGL